MRDPRASAPNWSALFARAHQRVARRLFLMGAIGAIGAGLLLGGGIAARAAIKDNEVPPSRGGAPSGGETPEEPKPSPGSEPSPGPEPSPGSEPSPGEQPNLIFVSASLTAAPGDGSFTVKNDSSDDARAFSVRVVPSKGEPQEFSFSKGLAGGDEVSESFRCPVGDTVTLTIVSSQIDEPNSEDVKCARSKAVSPTEGEETESTEPSEPSESREVEEE